MRKKQDERPSSMFAGVSTKTRLNADDLSIALLTHAMIAFAEADDQTAALNLASQTRIFMDTMERFNQRFPSEPFAFQGPSYREHFFRKRAGQVFWSVVSSRFLKRGISRGCTLSSDIRNNAAAYYVNVLLSDLRRALARDPANANVSFLVSELSSINGAGSASVLLNSPQAQATMAACFGEKSRRRELLSGWTELF